MVARKRSPSSGVSTSPRTIGPSCARPVFGANRAKPIERNDMAGLVVLINGRGWAALTDTEAIIQCAAGGRVTFRRKWQEQQTGQVLLWELADSNDEPGGRV